MPNRRLTLKRLAHALEAGDQRTVAAVATALREATSASDLFNALAPAMTPEEREQRDRHIFRAAEKLPPQGRREELTRVAQEIEQRMITGDIDPDRPGSWPPLPEHHYRLARALCFGCFPSKSWFHKILAGQSSEPENWTVPEDEATQRKLNEALRTKWKTPA